MDGASSNRSPTPWIASVAAVGALWWVSFEGGDRVPLLTYVNLGVHELGHVATYAASDLVTALAGSVAQVALPAVLATYFLVRGDWLGAGLCLAWGATSAVEVAAYVADARERELELLGGGMHDWAFILGPEGYDAIERTDALAATIRDGAWAALVAGWALCLLAPLRAAGGQAESEAATSRTTPASTA